MDSVLCFEFGRHCCYVRHSLVLWQFMNNIRGKCAWKIIKRLSIYNLVKEYNTVGW